MKERDRRPGGGDIRGPTRGDPSARLRTGFTDWDNPEDEIEDVPEGYYDSQTGGRPDEDEDEEYEIGPEDPDYDLSEGAGYSGWEGRRRRRLLPFWLIVAISLLFIFAMIVPALLRF
jgi:hypothetical protein